MEKILYIKANPKNADESYTLKIAEEFLKRYRYRRRRDSVVVVELDLYREGLKHVDMEEMEKIFSQNKNNLTEYADNFIKFDKYIVAAPMWNLSIPSILKTYIDHITVAGKTFKYTKNGPVGLLKNKKVMHITSRGGVYSMGPGVEFEMGDRYLRTIFGFMGIEDFSTLVFESTESIVPDEVERSFKVLMENIDDYVESF